MTTRSPDPNSCPWRIIQRCKRRFQKTASALLNVAGEIDNIIPAHLNKRNYNAYAKDNGSVTEYKAFEGRNHFVVAQSTWPEDAGYIYDWFQKHG